MRKTVRKATQKASKKPLRDLSTLESRARQVKAGRKRSGRLGKRQ